MYKKIRKSVAEAITNVEDPEQFQWNKWLREPQIFWERFPKPQIAVRQLDNFKTFDEPTLYQVKKFSLTKFKLSEEIKNIVVKKRKTFKIFFSFPKTVHQKLPIFNPNVIKSLFELSVFYKEKELFVRTKKDNKESIASFSPTITSNKLSPIKVLVKTFQANIQSVDSTNHDCLLTKPNLLDNILKLLPSLTTKNIFNLNFLIKKDEKKYIAIAFNKLDKKPSLKNILVLTLDKIKEQLQNKDVHKILSIPINGLLKLPKLYKINFTTFEKIKVPLFHLKSLQIKNIRESLISFSILADTRITHQNLLSKFESQLQIIIPEITNQLLPNEEKVVKPKTSKTKPEKAEVPINTAKVEEKITTVSWDESEADFKHLLNHQKEGVKFLLKNKTALLCDELGIDKKVQTVYALDAAIKHGLIKNALIICPESHIGNKKIGECIKNSEGWENQITKVNPNLHFESVGVNNKSEILDSAKNINIQIISYKKFTELTSGPAGAFFSKKIECLILDEAQYLLNDEIQTEQLFNFPHSDFTWILTSLPLQIIEERLVPKLRSHLAGFEKLDGYLNRTKDSLGIELPSIMRNDFWHEFDTEQAQEFENTLLLGRKRIADLVKGGNPFIIQSNIFTLIHQIKQLGNFSVHKETSPKTDLLLDQLESIIASGQKSIIFSQYDKQGIQKIERLLKNNQIKYVLYQSGMPLKELEKSANAFKNESKIHVMLAGLTAASIKVKIPDAAYLIHFDQWWNPINQWQYEDRSLSTDDHGQSIKSINVINYFGNNSVEINTRETLQKKGLLIKNLVEFLSNEMIYSLMSNEDWLDILGIEYTRTRKNALPDIEAMMGKWSQASIDEIGQKTKLLFTRLGYKNLLLKPDMLHEEIIVYAVANKLLHEIKTAILCLPFKVKDSQPVQDFIKDALKNNSRIFVICSDEIVNHITPDPHEKVTYIGQKLFVNYLAQFKIT